MILARPALASAVHPCLIDFGPGRSGTLSGQIIVERDAYPGRCRPPSSRGAHIAPGGEVNRASVRAGFRRSCNRHIHRPIRQRLLIRSHGRRVPWATPGDWSGPWAHIGHEPTGGDPIDPRTARDMDAMMVHSALTRTRLRRAGKPTGGWTSELDRAVTVRPLWARIESLLAALAAVVAEQLPFLAWWLPRRDDSPGGRRHRAALLRSTTAPTRGPSRRPTAGHRSAGCATS